MGREARGGAVFLLTIQIANAPCSWGSLEFDGLEGESIGYGRMLDELVEAGYAGTELGDWGYMPTDPVELHAELLRRDIAMLGAFVPVALKEAAKHASGEAEALKVARLLKGVAGMREHAPSPFLVLADDNGSDPTRTLHAGRVTPGMGLSDSEWEVFARGAERIARAVHEETGLRTVFHHHCAGYVETPAEIARLLDMTDSERLGLVFDTGHFFYGSGSNEAGAALEFLSSFAERVWYMHFKDCDPGVAGTARREGWDYFEALRRGVFCELGQGGVDFPAVLRWLRAHDEDAWIVVEQDVLPGMGSPKESARRNREYLRLIGV